MRKPTDTLCIDTIRFLSAEAVERANSGHPGAPMGAAPAAYTLFDRFLRFCPTEPRWFDRDRFILSAGHASMLLYSLLHLYGYDLSLDELRNFRQLGSKTPGHPEYGLTPGVEATTGPLGQGVSNGVGMAMAERALACRYNRPNFKIIDHYTYALISDGDLQEGVSAEAASLAGTLGLGKLVCLYDDNSIQIEGSTDLAFLEDVGERFRAYGWQVVDDVDGEDVAALEEALVIARAELSRPSLVICKTTIGVGSPKAGTAAAHGEPLGPEALAAAKAHYGWTRAPFEIPGEVLVHTRRKVEEGEARLAKWHEKLAAYSAEYPVLAARLKMEMAGELPEGWDAGLDGLLEEAGDPQATRNVSGLALNGLAARIGNFLGGSADLAPSTKTIIKQTSEGKPAPHFSAGTQCGPNVHYGVREHAMGAAANGMALHGGVIPYTATFLTFSDYMRPAMRLAALSHLPVIHVFTHDSIGLGEDGPTHQPVEHLMALRAMPNTVVIRPADAAETLEAWRAAVLRTHGPTSLILTRQKVPSLRGDDTAPADGLHKGAYVLWESGAAPDAVLIGTGSEVQLALTAGRRLAKEGVATRVVSMPSWELFDAQDETYKTSVIPLGVPKDEGHKVKALVSVEAGVTLGWERYIGRKKGAAVGIDSFGDSAPYEEVYAKHGITAEAVYQAAKALL